jgi:hypothetical protein
MGTRSSAWLLSTLVGLGCASTHDDSDASAGALSGDPTSDAPVRAPTTSPQELTKLAGAIYDGYRAIPEVNSGLTNFLDQGTCALPAGRDDLRTAMAFQWNPPATAAPSFWSELSTDGFGRSLLIYQRPSKNTGVDLVFVGAAATASFVSCTKSTATVLLTCSGVGAELPSREQCNLP